MRRIIVGVFTAVLALGAVVAEGQQASSVPTGLFAVCGVHSRVALANADATSFPSAAAEFTASGVTADLNAFYLEHVAGLGCNALGIEIALPCDPEPTANALANLCTWAQSLGATKPYLLVTLAGPGDPATAGGAGELVAALAGKLAAGADPQAYQRIVGYRLAPAMNLSGGASAAPAAAAAAAARDLRAAIQAAEVTAFGQGFAPTPFICDFSVDYALLSQGAPSSAALTQELRDQVFAQASDCLLAAREAGAADVYGLDWLPGTLSAGTVDDVAGLVRRLATAYPDQALMLTNAGLSTAFETRQGQADYCLGLLAALAAEAPSAPGLVGLCWAADIDSPAPDAPDAQVSQRVAAWAPDAAAASVAAALRGEAVDADTGWWIGRSVAELGLIGFDAAGALAPKLAAASLRALVGQGVAVAEAPAEQPTPADLAVVRFSLAEGALVAGQQATLAAQIHNPGTTDATGVRVDFSYAGKDGADWRYVTDQSVVVDVPAGGQVEARSGPWTVAEGAENLGVAAWRDGVTETNDKDNAMVASATDLAAGPVSAEGAPPAPAADEGGIVQQVGDAVVGRLKALFEQKKSEVAEQLINAVGGYLLGGISDLLGDDAAGFLGGTLSDLLGFSIGGEAAGTAGGGTGAGDGGGTATGTPDLAVTALELTSGTLTPGQTVVLGARMRNLSPDAAAAAGLVDFSYVAEGMTEWAFVNPASLNISATPGQEVSVATQAWTVPEGLQQVGVAAYLPSGADANQGNDTITATPAELAGGPVVVEAGGTTEPAVVTPDPSGPADLAITSLEIASGSLAEGQQAVLRATVANPAAFEVADGLVDFSYCLEGAAEWQFVAAEPLPVTIAAGGTAQVSAPAWTVPANLSAVGVAVWRPGGVDPVGENNSLAASPAELGAGVATVDEGDGETTGGPGGAEVMVTQRPTTAKVGRAVEYAVEAPAAHGRGLQGAAYLKVDGKTVDTQSMSADAQKGNVGVTLHWTPAEAGKHQLEVVVPGAGNQPVQLTVEVQAGSRFERLPGVLRTPAIERAAGLALLPAGAAVATGAGRKVPRGGTLSTALGQAARGALVASAGARAGTPAPAPKPMSGSGPTRLPATVIATLPPMPGTTAMGAHTTSQVRRLPTGAATAATPATGGTRLPTAPRSVATRLPTLGTGGTTATGGGTAQAGAGGGTTPARHLPTAPIAPGTLRPAPGTLGTTTRLPGGTAPTLPRLEGPAPTGNRLPGGTATGTIRLPGATGGVNGLASPITLQLPTGSVTTARPTTISYALRDTQTPVTAVSFLLGYDARAVKVSAVGIRGMAPGQLGWRVTTTQMATGLLVTLSGTKPLVGTGKLLSLTLANASSRAAAATLTLSQTTVNGKTVPIPVTGGTVQLTQ